MSPTPQFMFDFGSPNVFLSHDEMFFGKEQLREVEELAVASGEWRMGSSE